METKYKLVRNYFILIIVIGIFINCQITDKYFKFEYKFSDSNNRNIIISFQSDSSYLLINSVSGDLAYSTMGKFISLNKYSILLYDPNLKFKNTITINHAAKEGEKIDVIKAYYDRSYIFPTITSDTIFFKRNYKDFILKGYKFNRVGKVHR